VDNIIAALLEHNDRIQDCKLNLSRFSNSRQENVLAAMRQPFPALTRLAIDLGNEIDETVVVPASFLGGSAPCLRSLDLRGIPFPGLPNLLLSATHLVDLDLFLIPNSGYFSPESMVTGLSASTRLETLSIFFESPQISHSPRSRRPPLLTRVLLPNLNNFLFSGASKYVDDLMSRIDAPLLDNMEISFFYQPVFDTQQLTEFISRTPKLKPHDEARVVFDLEHNIPEVWVSLPQTFGRKFRLGSEGSQGSSNSSLAQICSLSFLQAFASAVEKLYIFKSYPYERLKNGIRVDDSHWIDMFHPFTAVKDLYISKDFVPHITSALQELIGQRATEVLPALKTLFLEGTVSSGPVQEAIGQFVASRQLSGHPIAIFSWRLDRVVNLFEDEFDI
jgi:hypothetical protein